MSNERWRVWDDHDGYLGIHVPGEVVVLTPDERIDFVRQIAPEMVAERDAALARDERADAVIRAARIVRGNLADLTRTTSPMPFLISLYHLLDHALVAYDKEGTKGRE